MTYSIEDRGTGEVFPGVISLLHPSEFAEISRAKGWHYDWTVEFTHPLRKVYKLAVEQYPTVIQGIISLELKPDHVYIHLIESAPLNRGRQKVFSGVATSLAAFACARSFENGSEGRVRFISEPALLDHYTKSWGAFHAGGDLMIINTEAALRLTGR